MTQVLHHQTTREVAGVQVVACPLRDSSLWHRIKQERACRQATNHCFHPDGMIGWWCCMCPAETDGMPPQECVHCAPKEKK